MVSPRDLRETYLPAFKACVQEGGAASVMGAYNRTNGEPCCASPTLLQKILREEWGFDGLRRIGLLGHQGLPRRPQGHPRRPQESAALAVGTAAT